MRLPARAATSAWAVARGVAWIHRRRALHRPLAQPLDGEALDGLARYFPPDLLEAIRVHRVPRIRAPWPVGLLNRLGWPPIDFGHVWGITYLDTIVLATSLVEEERETACLFHECVHAAQVRTLGPAGFVVMVGKPSAGRRDDLSAGRAGPSSGATGPSRHGPAGSGRA